MLNLRDSYDIQKMLERVRNTEFLVQEQAVRTSVNADLGIVGMQAIVEAQEKHAYRKHTEERSMTASWGPPHLGVGRRDGESGQMVRGKSKQNTILEKF